jgi:hypothetical protein
MYTRINGIDRPLKTAFRKNFTLFLAVWHIELPYRLLTFCKHWYVGYCRFHCCLYCRPKDRLLIDTVAQPWIVQIQMLHVVDTPLMLIVKRWLQHGYNHSRQSHTSETFHAYMCHSIQRPAELKNNWTLVVGMMHCGCLLCSLLNLHKNCWCSVDAYFQKVVGITTVAYLPKKLSE